MEQSPDSLDQSQSSDKQPDNNDPQNEAVQKLLRNNWLRREAGEGWRAEGIDEVLLNWIVIREQRLDDVVAGDSIQGVSDGVYQSWATEMARVQQYKAEHHIPDPPPRLKA